MAGTLGQMAMSLIRRHGPRVVRELTRSMATPTGREPTRPAGGNRATRTSPTATQARQIAYSPRLDGAADPGEVVWTWVEFEDDPDRGKDRPVVVVGRDGPVLLGLMLSSQEHRRGDANWMSIGTGGWDSAHRESFARLDRVLTVPENAIRREGAIVDRGQFDRIATVLRERYGWR